MIRTTGSDHKRSRRYRSFSAAVENLNVRLCQSLSKCQCYSPNFLQLSLEHQLFISRNESRIDYLRKGYCTCTLKCNVTSFWTSNFPKINYKTKVYFSKFMFIWKWYSVKHNIIFWYYLVPFKYTHLWILLHQINFNSS